jgi:iron(III) transport system substrate-binding protein
MSAQLPSQPLRSNWRRVLSQSALAGALFALATSTATAQDKVLNLYSARHYQTDEALYENFTKATGIKINRLEAGDEPLLERLRAEGTNSPADVLLMVDAARLWRAQTDGLFQPVKSSILESRIPVQLRGADSGKGSEWFGFSTRARVIVYNNMLIKREQVLNYEDLAKPELKGKVCTRSGAHPYMLSLIGAMSEHLGEAQAEQWAKGVVSNFAYSPKGGDTDQIKAVADGSACAVTVSNTYYAARILRSTKAEDRDLAGKIGIVMPNQASWGTHLNVSGGGVLKNARNVDAAVKFLEYLASDQAQAYFAEGNNEWPVVKSAGRENPALKSMGEFKADPLPIAQVGKAQINAARIIDRAGWR